ncbi:MAG TPA: hypothetical protein PLX23_05775 [Candidatus Hydrogenedens sp.]|nr:hypothetical protein [Candidatus Hydrogenedens sp.]
MFKKKYNILLSMIILIVPVIIFPSAYAEDGLVAYWSFDEGSGNVAKDYSGNENIARVVNAKWTKGISGNAISLNGNEYLICGDGLELCFVFPADYSIEAWVKHNNKDFQIYLSKWTGSGSKSAWWLGYYEGVVQFGDYYDGGQVCIKGNDIADGEWHYAVGVRQGPDLSLYIDGNKVAGGKSPYKVAGDNVAPVKIGGFGLGAVLHSPLVGDIDEVRIYNRALSEKEIQERYQLIKSGKKPQTLTTIANGLPLEFYSSVNLSEFYNVNEPINCLIKLVASKPVENKDFTIRIKNLEGKIVEETKNIAEFNNGKVSETNITIPSLKEATYTLEVEIDGQKKIEKNLIVKDITPIVQENKSIIEQRAKTSPFYRGIVSAYAGMKYKQDGTPDNDVMISILKDLGVNCYTYLICSRSDKELSALGDFCDKALREGIEVWVYLVPPTEAPIDRDKPIAERKYPPFDMNYLKWSEAIAKISLEHPNMTLWMIDDFDGNLSFFNLDYTKQIYQTSKNINPKLLFGVCVYHESLNKFAKSGYLDFTDALLWGYQHNSSAYLDCGLNCSTLPIEINDYLKTGKIAIPCIYFTPHSSWQAGRPTKEYLEKAIDIAFQQSGIVWVFTTPATGTVNYDVVKNFTNFHKLQKLTINK